jgi:hypothetical protein
VACRWTGQLRAREGKAAYKSGCGGCALNQKTWCSTSRRPDPPRAPLHRCLERRRWAPATSIVMDGCLELKDHYCLKSHRQASRNSEAIAAATERRRK